MISLAIGDMVRETQIDLLIASCVTMPSTVRFYVSGHNELDEPSFTSPVMYRAVRSRPSFPTAYAQQLISSGDLTAAQQQALVEHLQVRSASSGAGA